MALCFKSLPHNYRQGLLSKIYILNRAVSEERSDTLKFARYYLRYVGCLYNQAELEALRNEGKKVVSLETLGPNTGVSAGDYVVDGYLRVYRIYGWDRENGGASFYYDFLDGLGVINVRDYLIEV